MTKKIILFSLLLIFTGIINTNKASATNECENRGGICEYSHIPNQGTPSSPCDSNHWGETSNSGLGCTVAPSSEYINVCCLPTCQIDEDCEACYSCKTLSFFDYTLLGDGTKKICKVDISDNNNCDNGICKMIDEVPTCVPSTPCVQDSECDACNYCFQGYCRHENDAEDGRECNDPCTRCKNGVCKNIDDGEQHGCQTGNICINAECTPTCINNTNCPPCFSCKYSSGIVGFGQKICKLKPDEKNKCNSQPWHYCSGSTCVDEDTTPPAPCKSGDQYSYCSYNNGFLGLGGYCADGYHPEIIADQCTGTNGPDPGRCCVANTSTGVSCKTVNNFNFDSYCSYSNGFLGVGGYCDSGYHREESFSVNCQGDHNPDPPMCCVKNCQSNDDCPTCHSCNGGKCEINDPDRNKCQSDTCAFCEDGVCNNCAAGKVCFTSSGTCVNGCTGSNAKCRTQCFYGETPKTDSEGSYACKIDNPNKVCCTGGDGIDDPCVQNESGECRSSASCDTETGTIINNKVTECDETGQICCSMPCVKKFEGTCKDTNSTLEPGEHPIPDGQTTECGTGKTCYTKKCEGIFGVCQTGYICHPDLKICEIITSDCQKGGGTVEVPIADNPENPCPTGKIKDQTLTESLSTSDDGKICCVPVENEKVVPPTSEFFDGISCIAKGDCELNDILKTAANITKVLAGIVGSVALLFFIIAGLMMIFSGGSEEKVTKAKTMMVQTVIGLFIFLGAYTIVLFIQKSIGLDESKWIIADVPKMVEVVPTPPEVPQATAQLSPCKQHNKQWECIDKPSNYNDFLTMNTCVKDKCDSPKVCCGRCEIKHPGWSCKDCGTEAECDTKVSENKCERGFCPYGNTHLCCQ